VDKKKLNSEKANFVKWKNLDDNYDIEIYIEKEIVSDFKKKPEILIDVAVANVKAGKIGMLFIKKENVYG
jgi:hypothetical protein